MTRHARFATDLEIRHFLELISPLRPYLDDDALDFRNIPPELEGAKHKVMRDLHRFGYIPHATRLLVKMDEDLAYPVLTLRQRLAVHRELSALYSRLRLRG